MRGAVRTGTQFCDEKAPIPGMRVPGGQGEGTDVPSPQ
jgi:hypothetical protein